MKNKVRHIEMKKGKVFVRTIEQAEAANLPTGFCNVFTDYNFKASSYSNKVRLDLNINLPVS